MRPTGCYLSNGPFTHVDSRVTSSENQSLLTRYVLGGLGVHHPGVGQPGRLWDVVGGWLCRDHKGSGSGIGHAVRPRVAGRANKKG